MKITRFITVLLIGGFVVAGCGKVTNETGVTKPAEEKIYYTTLVGQVPVDKVRDQEEYTLTPSDNALAVSFSLVNKDGSETVLAWGKGVKEKPATPDSREAAGGSWASKSYGSESKAISKETEDDILVKWVPRRQNTPEHWEYYIRYESSNKAVYLVNVMNYDGSYAATIPLDGKEVSENGTVELSRPSRKTTLWSRIFVADENKNIVKKSTLTIAEIASRFSDKVYGTLRYKPGDLRVKRFSVERPQWLAPSEQSLEYYLSEALVQAGQGSPAYTTFLQTLPGEVVPTMTVEYLRGFSTPRKPASQPAPVLPQYHQKPFPALSRPPVPQTQR